MVFIKEKNRHWKKALVQQLTTHGLCCNEQNDRTQFPEKNFPDLIYFFPPENVQHFILSTFRFSSAIGWSAWIGGVFPAALRLVGPWSRIWCKRSSNNCLGRSNSSWDPGGRFGESWKCFFWLAQRIKSQTKSRNRYFKTFFPQLQKHFDHRNTISKTYGYNQVPCPTKSLPK